MIFIYHIKLSGGHNTILRQGEAQSLKVKSFHKGVEAFFLNAQGYLWLVFAQRGSLRSLHHNHCKSNKLFLKAFEVSPVIAAI